jgi:hypothetical protein
MWSPEATPIMRRIVATANTDILIFNAPSERGRDRRLIKTLMSRPRRRKLLMILVTNGGERADCNWYLCF